MSSSEFINPAVLNIHAAFADFRPLQLGNYASVFKLTIASKRGKLFVLKSLKPQYADNLIYRELLNKEFEIGYTIDHPNIRQTIQIEQVAGYGECLILEYIDGVPLDQFILRANSTQIAHIFEQLCSALAYIHSRQIVHKDLEPENILITHNGANVKLIDFGFSDTDNYQDFKTPAGTIEYMPIEQKKGDILDARSDVYSLGIICRKLFGQYIPKSTIKKACAPNIDDRYSSVDDFRRAVSISKNRRYWLVRSLPILILLSIGCWVYYFQNTKTHISTLNPVMLGNSLPSPQADSVVAASSNTKPKPKQISNNNIQPSKATKGAYAQGLSLPNSFDGYSVKDLGGLATKTFDSLKLLTVGDSISYKEFERQSILICNHYFKNIPDCVQ